MISASVLASALKLASLLLQFIAKKDAKRLELALGNLQQLKDTSDEQINQAYDAHVRAQSDADVGRM